mgnify:CR=1 FL=1
MVKIAFFDIDGTLLKLGRKELSPNTLAALQMLQHNGILLCMATGRSYPGIPHFDGIAFDIYLTFNGSYVVSHDRVIRKEPLNRSDVACIVRNLRRMNRAIAISNTSEIVTNGTDPELEQYFSFGRSELIIAENFDELCNGDVFQIMCSCRKEEYNRILEGTTNARITAWWDKAADIIPLSGGKGAAVADVLKFFGFSRDEAIAFGDGINDIEMLQAVGTGVAMGNAKAAVKEIADEICGSVEDDGVFTYCRARNFFRA